MSSAQRHWFPRATAVAMGVFFLVFGLWCMVAPRSFFETFATFEPYNQHFLQDLGAFQIGLGAVLLLAALAVRADALAVALVGVGIGSGAHTLSHAVGHDLGGTPVVDVPVWALFTVLLLAAGALRWQEGRTAQHAGSRDASAARGGGARRPR